MSTAPAATDDVRTVGRALAESGLGPNDALDRLAARLGLRAYSEFERLGLQRDPDEGPVIGREPTPAVVESHYNSIEELENRLEAALRQLKQDADAMRDVLGALDSSRKMAAKASEAAAASERTAVHEVKERDRAALQERLGDAGPPRRWHILLGHVEARTARERARAETAKANRAAGLSKLGIIVPTRPTAEDLRAWARSYRDPDQHPGLEPELLEAMANAYDTAADSICPAEVPDGDQR